MFLFEPREAQHCQLKQIPATGKAAAQLYFGPYRLLQTLGEGEFAKVKLAALEDCDKRFAIKFIRKSMLMPVKNNNNNNQSHHHNSQQHTRRLEKLRREVRILQTVRHSAIVQLVQVLESEKYVGLVMEYAQGGELFDHILARRFLREPEARRMFRQLMEGVAYLHQRDVVHRDLKLENLLLDHQRNVKITDFGFANYDCSHRQDYFLKTSCGSPCYAAPELVLGDGYKGGAADIWSCGVILYAMLCGYLPFDDDPDNPESANVNKLYQYIVATELSFPDHVSKAARDLVRGLLNPDPAVRLTIDQIFRHEWMMVGVPPPAPQQSLRQESLCKAVEAVRLADGDQENQVPGNFTPRQPRDSRSISMPTEKQQIKPQPIPNQSETKNRPPALNIQKLSPGVGGSVWSASSSSARPRSGTSPLTTGSASIPSAVSASSQSSDSSNNAIYSAASSNSGHRSSASATSSVWNKLFTKRHHVKNYSTSAVHEMQHTQDTSRASSNDASTVVSPTHSTDMSQALRPSSDHSLKLTVFRGAMNQDLISSILSPAEMLHHVQNILQAVPTVTLSPSSTSCPPIQPPLPTHRRSSGSTSSLNFLQIAVPPVPQTESQPISATFCGGRVLIDPTNEFELTVTWTSLKEAENSQSRSSSSSVQSEPTEMASATPSQCDSVNDSHPSFGDRVKRSWREIRRSLAMLSAASHNSNGGEVKFAIEVCRLHNLPGVYYLHFKRIRGDLWQYKRIYKLCAERFRAISNERFVMV